MLNYEHDCDNCVPLGELRIEDGDDYAGVYDLYFCPNEPTFVARWSSDGPHYYSGLGVRQNPVLAEAERRYEPVLPMPCEFHAFAGGHTLEERKDEWLRLVARLQRAFPGSEMLVIDADFRMDVEMAS